MISDLIEELANTIEAETEFIPLIGKEEGETMQSSDVPGVLPVLPVRNNVLFPGAVLPITLTRDKSLTLIKKHYKDKTPIGV